MSAIKIISLLLLSIWSFVHAQVVSVTSTYTIDKSTKLDLDKLRRDQLIRHNQLRAKHGCPPLYLLDDLSQIAQRYNKYLFQLKNLVHSDYARNGRVGQNLYYGWGAPRMKYDAAGASQSWYNQVKYYNYNTFKSNDAGQAVGHFTAMIWKSARFVGFGIQYGPQDGGYAVYVTANYYPVTNVIGKYKQNVPPPIN